MAELRLAELVTALSLATDLGMGQPMEHALRTCLVSLRLGEAVGLSRHQLGNVYYVALLRFLGCTADAHETAAAVERRRHRIPCQHSAGSGRLAARLPRPEHHGARPQPGCARPGARAVGGLKSAYGRLPGVIWSCEDR